MYKKKKISHFLLCIAFFSVYIVSCTKIEEHREKITILHPFQIINISQTDTLLVQQGSVPLLVHMKDKIKIDFPVNFQNSGYNWAINIVLPNDEVITEVPYEFQIDNENKYIGLVDIKATGISNNGQIEVQSAKLEIRLIE